MILEKTNSLRLKFDMQAIPISLAALVMWAIIGGWYVSIVPTNMAGQDNVGIVLSTFGLCLFLADRLAFLWWRISCWVLICPIWMWGLAFASWGLFEWLHAFSRRYVSIFLIHWSVFVLIIAVTILLVGRRRHQAD